MIACLDLCGCGRVALPGYVPVRETKKPMHHCRLVFASPPLAAAYSIMVPLPRWVFPCFLWAEAITVVVIAWIVIRRNQ